MSELRFDSINDAQLYLLKDLLENGTDVKTRGLITKEITPFFFAVTNPRKRITTLNGRNWNFAAALGELSWHLAVSNDLEFITSYLSGWKYYSADQKIITGSCYGKKIFNKGPSRKSQWDKVTAVLKNDHQSRRAVIGLFDTSGDIDETIPDVSCTISLQFLVRNNCVDIIVNMRSNDAIWGLPFDFFFFSYLQELMAFELSLDVGIYHHMAGSMHIYERHYDMAEQIIGNVQHEAFEMPPVRTDETEFFLRTERKIRSGKMTFAEIEHLQIDNYWKELLEILFHYYLKKNHFVTNSGNLDFLKHNPYQELV
ncbi:thymidylate synthase [Mucilaginibacter gynuensis]|uniref:thymidylate synthase n=1 Tax=Mucilaginibacter gynuensis TaxID=1302236 RepID=A0ABP8GL86_9SPHI